MTPARVHPLSLGLSWSFLVEFSQGLILVDAGPPGAERAILKRLRELGRNDLRLIFLTHAHFDHYGGAAALREATGAPIAIHNQDEPILARGKTPLGSVRGRGALVRWLLPLAERFYNPAPIQADLICRDGEGLPDLNLPITVLHTPGHTPGSSTLLVEGRLAFAGDLLSSTGRPHLQRYFAHDWNALPESLRRLQRRDPIRVFPGHGGRPLTREELQSLRP